MGTLTELDSVPNTMSGAGKHWERYLNPREGGTELSAENAREGGGQPEGVPWKGTGAKQRAHIGRVGSAFEEGGRRSQPHIERRLAGSLRIN